MVSSELVFFCTGDTLFGCNYVASGLFAQSCNGSWILLFACWILVHDCLIYMKVMWWQVFHFYTYFSSYHNIFQVVFWLHLTWEGLILQICLTGFASVTTSCLTMEYCSIPLNIWISPFPLLKPYKNKSLTIWIYFLASPFDWGQWGELVDVIDTVLPHEIGEHFCCVT